MNNKQRNLNAIRETGFTLLSEGKTLRVKATGYSMYPAIKPGSFIYIDPCNEQVKAGDIIAWKCEKGIVVHRLLWVAGEDKEKIFITRGDSLMTEDAPVAKELYAGKVIKIENPEGNPTTIHIFRSKRPNYRFNRFRALLDIYLKRITGYFR